MVVGANVRLWRGNGLLIVHPGLIIFEAGRILRRLTSVTRIVHTAPEVTLIYSRFAPPWINTFLVVEGPEETIVAGTWCFARRRLRESLRSAGFEIVEVRTRFSFGGDRIRY
jgi:hypothetical protein